METTEQEQGGYAAMALWRLGRPPYKPGDVCPVPEGDKGETEMLLALCRDVDTLEAALRHTQKVLHDTTCQGEMDCVEACESAYELLRDPHPASAQA